jgi:hypothetical protein
MVQAAHRTRGFWMRGSMSEVSARLEFGGLSLRGRASSFLAVTFSVLIYSFGTAQSGPCTAEIAQLKAQIAATAPGPESGPTATQSVGAQLHHQPTPDSVRHAEHAANADADAALARAQQADAEGNAELCARSLSEAKRLYGID